MEGRLTFPWEILSSTLLDGVWDLVGRFQGLRPDLDELCQWAMVKWKPQGSLEIIALPRGFFLIQLEREYDMKNILANGPGSLAGEDFLSKGGVRILTPLTKYQYKPSLGQTVKSAYSPLA